MGLCLTGWGKRESLSSGFAMDNVRVFDRVLPEADFAAVTAFSENVALEVAQYGTSIWARNPQANPSQSEDQFVWTPAPLDALARFLPAGVSVADVTSLPNLKVCPTRTSVDAVFTAIARLAESRELEHLVGSFGRDWIAVTCRVFSYSKLAKANWHTDQGPYAGAFVYYTHPEWHREWGGQLLYNEGQAFQDTGRFLAPTPNRLVVIKSGTHHTVANVSEAAQDHRRLTVAGFFVRPDGVPKMLEELTERRSLRASS